MASRQATVDWIVDQAGGTGTVSARRMFGEYALYSDGKLVGLICDDQLYVKPTTPGRAFFEDAGEAPPYPGAKPCLVVPGERCDDGDWLSELIRISSAALPAPKPKASRGKRP